MQESDNQFAYWQTMGRESPERLADFFFSRLELLSPVNQEAFIAARPHRDDLIDRIRMTHTEPERRRPHTGRLSRTLWFPNERQSLRPKRRFAGAAQP